MPVRDAGERRTAYNPPSRGVDPNCGVCLGTGVDLIFECECTECWSRRDANIAETRDMLAQRYSRTKDSHYHPGPPFSLTGWLGQDHAGVTYEEAAELRMILMGRGERPPTQEDDDRFEDYLFALSHPPV